MRRSLLFLSLALSMLIASPTFALDLNISGSLQFEGVYNENPTLDDSDPHQSFREMRLRVLTEAQVTDKIKLITRFDALDKLLSSRDSAFDNDEDDDNIDFDRAYAEIITPIGLLSIGRMQGVVWGTSWSDDEADTDRIKLVTPIPIGENKLYIGAVAEKVYESYNPKTPTAKDEDNNKYYIGATYKTPNYSTGLLTSFYDYNLFQDPGQKVAYKKYQDAASDYAKAATTAEQARAVADGLTSLGTPSPEADFKKAAAALLAAGAKAKQDEAFALFATNPRGTTCKGEVFLLAPYFDGKFGPLGITTELDYVFGETEYDTNDTTRDVEAFGWFGELRYDIGPVTVQAGYAINTGDSNYDDDKIKNMGYVAPGADWAKAFILTNDEHGMNTTLGDGLGNLVADGFGTGYIACLDGYRMMYAGADYQVLDNLSIGALIASSQADDTPSGIDDDHGIEYDLTLTWKIWDNLVYSGVAAFLQAGDYWKERSDNPNADADTYALYHKLEIFF